MEKDERERAEKLLTVNSLEKKERKVMNRTAKMLWGRTTFIAEIEIRETESIAPIQNQKKTTI